MIQRKIAISIAPIQHSLLYNRGRTRAEILPGRPHLDSDIGDGGNVRPRWDSYPWPPDRNPCVSSPRSSQPNKNADFDHCSATDKRLKGWKAVMFPDEKKSNLDRLDAWRYHWHYLSDEELYFSWGPYHKRSMTMHSEIWFRACSILACVWNKHSANFYMGTLKLYLLPNGSETREAYTVLSTKES